MEGIRSKGTYFQKLTVSTNIDSRNTIYSRNSGYLSKQFCVYIKKLRQIYHLLKLVKHVSSCLIVDLQLVLTVILKRTRIIFKPIKSMERPGNEATQTSHLHAHLHKTQRKLDVKRSNPGASQVHYITYSIVLFLLFSQFVLTIIFVVSLSSGEKTTGKWGHFTLVNIYICVCTCVTMCLCASVYPYLCLLHYTK